MKRKYDEGKKKIVYYCMKIILKKSVLKEDRWSLQNKDDLNLRVMLFKEKIA